MTPQLSQRIANIVSPPRDELALKRDAKVFGKLNVQSAFNLTAHVARSEQRGDVRARFAAIVGGA